MKYHVECQICNHCCWVSGNEISGATELDLSDWDIKGCEHDISEVQILDCDIR